jgi:lysozyme family protein
MIASNSSTWLNFTRHILRWEGKTSSDPRDTAAKCYPGGIHTNKGITFCTFKQLASKLGITPVTHDRFLQLTDQEVGLFIYEFYNSVRGPELPDSLALAATEAAWGSGPGRALQHLRDSVRDLGLPATTTSVAIRSAANIPARQLFDAYQARRKAFIENLGAQPKYAMFLRGWLNRLRSFNTRFRPAALIFPLFFLGITLLIISRGQK